MGALNQLGVDKTTKGKRKWTKYQYKFKETSVCRDFFKAAHDIKDFTLRTLIKHMNTNGLVEWVHGNTGKKRNMRLNMMTLRGSSTLSSVTLIFTVCHSQLLRREEMM